MLPFSAVAHAALWYQVRWLLHFIELVLARSAIVILIKLTEGRAHALKRTEMVRDTSAAFPLCSNLEKFTASCLFGMASSKLSTDCNRTN